MKPRDVFGLWVRIIGLLITIYGIWALVYGAIAWHMIHVNHFLGQTFTAPYPPSEYLMSGVPMVTVGLVLLRKAEWLVSFAYTADDRQPEAERGDA